MPPPTAELRGATLRRPRSLVLREVDLEIAPGESIAVFGSNGSGKTTLLRVLATLLAPTSGHGLVLGARLGTSEVEAIRPRIGLIGHDPALAPNLSLGENLRLIATLALGADGPDAATEALGTVGLAGAADRLTHRSSNGMRRRVEFARLLVTRPDFMLLDEAHVGLDPDAWSLVTHLMSDVTRRGGSAVVVAHEQERIRPLVDRAVTIADGRIEGTGA